MMLTIDDWLMGRDKDRPDELTTEIIENAGHLLARVNLLLTWAAEDDVRPAIDEQTGTHVASGWRPRAINVRVGGGQMHPNGEAIDLRDGPGRELARWCLRNLAALEEVGLWMEDPQWTPNWVHLQKRPPGSGRRVFIPSTKPPLVAKLPEQKAVGTA